MRFGFFFWPYTPEYTARMARLGEETGFDLVGIADTPGNALDPWVAMTLAAAATSRVALATCVTNLVTRHPSITASAAASVDAAAGGSQQQRNQRQRSQRQRSRRPRSREQKRNHKSTNRRRRNPSK